MSEPLSEVEIEDFMQRWSAAIVSNDVDLINQFVTSDWVLIDRAGVITLERFNDVVATGTLRHTEMTHEIVFTRTINDESVVVLTHGRNAGTYDGQPIEADEWSLQLLVDTPSGWRCALTQLTPRP